MRTYGRLTGEQSQPTSFPLNLGTFALSGVTATGGQADNEGGTSAYLFTATGGEPAAFGPALAIPVGIRAYYGLTVYPLSANMTFAVDYTDATGAAIEADVINYNIPTGTYDNSLAPRGAQLVVVAVGFGWYQATITLPIQFPNAVIGTQLEYWPVGIPPNYVAYGASSIAYGASYTLVPNTWQVVTTDANGYNDNVYLTTLAQVLKLNTGESPFYANYGIPQYQTIMTQVFPDYYVSQTQQQFSQHFASLVITRVRGTPDPTYNISAVTHNGAILNAVIAQ